MALSSRENEIKLGFSSPELALKRLRDAGAIEVRERAFEDNVLFDTPAGTLAGSGRLLRLRRCAEEALVTFKARVPGEHRHKVHVEHEARVSDGAAFERVLAGLGYEPRYRYQKYRTVYRLDRVEASLDETALGTFVELEGEPDDVDRAARSLGASQADYIRATYRELHEHAASARNEEPGDLLMPALPPGRAPR